jgi:hypothetical protein
MFLERFHWALHVATKGNQKFGCQQLKITITKTTIIGDWKKKIGHQIVYNQKKFDCHMNFDWKWVSVTIQKT